MLRTRFCKKDLEKMSLESLFLNLVLTHGLLVAESSWEEENVHCVSQTMGDLQHCGKSEP